MDKEKVRFYKTGKRFDKRKFLWLFLILPLLMLPFFWKKSGSAKSERKPFQMNSELMKKAERFRNYITKIRIFDSMGNLKDTCSGFFYQRDNIVTTIRSPFREASEFEVSNIGSSNRSYLFFSENPKSDLIYIPANYPSDSMEALSFELKIYLGENVFLIANSDKAIFSVIEGHITSWETRDHWGTIYILSCKFPEEMNGGPVFNEAGKVIGMARSIPKNAEEMLYFVLPSSLIKHDINQKGQPLKEMSPYLHPQYFPEFQDNFELARFLHKNKSYTQASEYVKEYLKTHSNQPDAWYYLGKCQDTYHWDTAMDCYKKAISLNPDYLEAKIDLALILLERKKYYEARNILEEVLKKDPSNAETISVLASIYMKIEDYDSAFHILDEALNTYRINDKSILCMMGRIYSRKEENLLAYRCFEEAVTLDPYDSEAYIEMGLHFVHIRNIDSGIRAMKKAIAFLPEEGAAHCLLGVFYIWQGNVEGYNKERRIVRELDERNKHSYDGYIRNFNSYLNSIRTHKVFKKISNEISEKLSNFREYYIRIHEKELLHDRQ